MQTTTSAGRSLLSTIITKATREIADGRVIATTGFWRAARNPFMDLSTSERATLLELDGRFWAAAEGGAA